MVSGGTLDLGAADRATKHALNTSAYGITVVALQIDYLLQKPAINLTDLALRECRIGKNYVALKKSTGRVPETSESTTIQVHVYGNFVDHSTSNGSINYSDPEVRNRIHPIFFMQKSEYGLVLLLNESGVTIHAKDGEKYCRSVNNLIDQMLRRQIWVTTKATIAHPYGTWGNSAEERRKGKLISGELKMQSEISRLDLMKTRSGSLVRAHSFQVFVKTSEGKSKLIWVKETDSVKQMQKIIMQQLGYPIRSQNLIHGGRVLQYTKYF